MLRASAATAAALLLTSIVYAAPARAADAVACDAAVPSADASGFTSLAGSPALLPATRSDAAVRHSTWLADDDHDPLQQDDAPALGLPGVQQFAWSLERFNAIAILADPRSRQHDRTRWSPRGPPL